MAEKFVAGHFPPGSTFGSYALERELVKKNAGKSIPMLVTRGGAKYFAKALDSPRIPVKLSGPAAERKISLCEHFETHQKRLYGAIRAAANRQPAVCDHVDFFRSNNYFISVYEFVDARLPDASTFRQPRFTLSARGGLVLDVLGALAALHGQGVVHSDVKLNNLLISKDDSKKVHAKLADYDDAYFAGRPTCAGVAHEARCDENYASPEVWNLNLCRDPVRQAELAARIGVKADMFSWAVLAIEILTGGRRSVSAKYAAELVIAGQKLEWAREGVHLGEAGQLRKVWPVVEAALAKSPESRPTANDALTRLRAVFDERDDVKGFIGSVPRPVPTFSISAAAARPRSNKSRSTADTTTLRRPVPVYKPRI